MYNRRFLSGILNHCYQRSFEGGVLFYSKSDYLVWFTIVCVMARKYSVRVLALCPMPDHTHYSLVAGSVKDLSAFMGAVNRTYSHAMNQACATKQSWFETTFGSAPKKEVKDGRSNLLYVGNNPVERKLEVNAEDCRWTFIAYAASDHPFSEKLVIRRASSHLRAAIREIRAQHASGKPVNHAQLKRMTGNLTPREQEQLIDYIIVTYNVIDYEEALRFFDRKYENYVSALHTTTSHEYDLDETFVGKSDSCYKDMTQVLLREKHLADIHEFLSWPRSDREALVELLRRRTSVSLAQIRKFLHLPKLSPVGLKP